MSGYENKQASEVKRRAPETVQQTFIARAQNDCIRLREMAEHWYSPRNRSHMVNFVLEKVNEAERIRYDDGLQIVYQSIHVLIRDWWWEEDIKTIILETLNALNQNQLIRQPSPKLQAAEREARLQQVTQERDDALSEVNGLKAELETTKNLYKTTLEAKSRTITLKNKTIVRLTDDLSQAKAEPAGYKRKSRARKTPPQQSHFFKPEDDSDRKKEYKKIPLTAGLSYPPPLLGGHTQV